MASRKKSAKPAKSERLLFSWVTVFTAEVVAAGVMLAAAAYLKFFAK